LAALLVAASLLPLSAFVDIRQSQAQLLDSTKSLLRSGAHQIARALDEFHRGRLQTVERIARFPETTRSAWPMRPPRSLGSGGHPSRGSPRAPAHAERQGGAGLRPFGPYRCARQCSDQGCAFIAMPNTGVRPALPAGVTTAARSRARGSRALFPSRCA